MRKSVPAKKIDERTFAVRVRIAIPEHGLRCLNEVHEWLRKTTGGTYAIHSARVPGLQDYTSIYLNDTAIALECVNRFGLQVYGLPKETP